MAVEMVEVAGLMMPKRLAEKIDLPAEPMTECWGWNASARNGKGRPQFWWHGRPVYAYRLTLSIRLGISLDQLGDDLGRHQCHNPQCSNPYHVEPGTHADNFRDMVEAGRANPLTYKLLAQGAARARAKQDRELRYLDERYAMALAAD